MHKLSMLKLSALFACLMPAMVCALSFVLEPGSDIIGSLQTATVQYGEDFDSIGQKFDIGVYEMIEANPDIDPREPPSGTILLIPTQFILPNVPRQGIVINLAEMRLYYFHKNEALVTTHPIGIGRKEWETPLATGKIIEKTKDPYWNPPSSIRAWYNENNKYLPDIVPPGPQNPLGEYAMRLSIPGYLIHGTNMTGGIGLRSSSGCIRMHPEDVESLFYKVSVGEQVRIIHQPYKIGHYEHKIYMEAHQPLSGEYYNVANDVEVLKQSLEDAGVAGYVTVEEATRASSRSGGYPILIK